MDLYRSVQMRQGVRPRCATRPACAVPHLRSTQRAQQAVRDCTSHCRTKTFLKNVHSRDGSTHPSRGDLQVPHASALADAEAEEGRAWSQTLFLGLLFGGWYLANISFNIYNKQVLQVFPYPVTLTVLQFGVGSILASLSWMTGLVKAPKVTKELLLSIAPLALVHTLGNMLTNCSLGAVAVSFTHTIKAMEPFFSVVLSAMFLGERASLPVVLSLVPIVAGVCIASVTEATFTWFGFLTAMGSNLTFQSRNVLSKKLMIKKDGLDNINMFSIITILSFLLLLPVSLLCEGFHMHPEALNTMGVAAPMDIIQKAVLAGVCFHTYQQVSYMILSRVSPVTHSVGNCVKRVVVIVASVFVFQNPVSMQNAIGTATALAGVALYSQIKRLTAKKPKAV